MMSADGSHFFHVPPSYSSGSHFFPCCACARSPHDHASAYAPSRVDETHIMPRLFLSSSGASRRRTAKSSLKDWMSLLMVCISSGTTPSLWIDPPFPYAVPSAPATIARNAIARSIPAAASKSTDQLTFVPLNLSASHSTRSMKPALLMLCAATLLPRPAGHIASVRLRSSWQADA